jgi:hypothetical protein
MLLFDTPAPFASPSADGGNAFKSAFYTESKGEKHIFENQFLHEEKNFLIHRIY